MTRSAAALLIGWIVQSAKRRAHATIPILSISRKELVASRPLAFGPAVDRHVTTQSESWHLMEPALQLFPSVAVLWRLGPDGERGFQARNMRSEERRVGKACRTR